MRKELSLNTRAVAFIWVVLAFGLITILQSSAQTYTVGAIFDAGSGAFPESPLIEGIDGSLYGTTFNGGGIEGSNCFNEWGCGTIYVPDGYLAGTLYSFCPQAGCLDGSLPTAGLVQATNGNLYGTTQGGNNGQQSPCGMAGCGTVFDYPFEGGGMITLHTFSYTDGGVPATGLVQARNGKLYGTTAQGGANGNYGTVFDITLSGTFNTLYNFCALANCADGYLPSGPLVQGGDGNLYGETEGGGTNNWGTIFKINSQGTLTTLYRFCAKANCADGGVPGGGLIQATDGNFYGTTSSGGAYRVGTVFRITPAGKLTVLHSFCGQTNCTDGEQPLAGVIQATNGNLYGTTYGGGANSYGTIFELSTTGKFTMLHSFCAQFACTDGGHPMAGLLEATDGYLYGTAPVGGTYGFGITYSLSGVGLSPFVRATPGFGAVGAPITLNGPSFFFYATSVSFNGVPATFTLVNDEEISTSVPSGATTGKISVVTTFGKYNSTVPFTVIP